MPWLCLLCLVPANSASWPADSCLGEVVLEATLTDVLRIRKGQSFESQRSLPEDDVRKSMARLGFRAETLDTSVNTFLFSCHCPTRLNTGHTGCFDVNCHSDLKEAPLPIFSSRNKI